MMIARLLDDFVMLDGASLSTVATGVVTCAEGEMNTAKGPMPNARWRLCAHSNFRSRDIRGER